MKGTVTADQGVLVGRESELAVIESRVADTLRARGGIVVLSGEVGAGKTRLLEAAVHVAQVARFATAATTNFQHARSPLGPWIDALSRLAQLVSTVMSSVSRDRAILESILGIAETPAARADKRRLFMIIAEALVRAASHAPLAIAFDDMQWSDPESLELLTFVAPRITAHRIIIVLSVRSDESDDQTAFDVRMLGRFAGVTTVTVGPLAEPAVREMVAANMPNGRRLSRKLVDEICSRGEGNPLLVSELIRGALDDGEVGLLAPTIAIATRRKTQSLGDLDRRVVETASALGRVFTLRDLVLVTELDHATVVAALRTARDLNIVRETQDTTIFAFRHELVRLSVYERLLVAQRRDIHLCIARMFDRELSEVPIALLAHHWMNAGDQARAAELYERAGDEAMRFNAFASARDHYSELARLSGESAARARVHEKLGVSLDMLGESARAAEMYERAAATLRAQGAEQDAARVDLRFANAAYRTGEGASAMLACWRVLSSVPPIRQRFGAHALLATYYAYRGDIANAEEHIHASDVVGDGEADVRDRLSLEWARATTSIFRGDDVWLPAAQRAVQLAEESGDPQLLALNLTNLGGMLRQHHSEGTAAQPLQRAIEVADSNGLTYTAAYARCETIEGLYLQGRLEEAVRMLREVARLHVDALIVRIFTASVGLPVLVDTDLLHLLPALAEPELLEAAYETGEDARYAPLAAAHVYAAALRNDSTTARLIIKRTLPLVNSIAYNAASLVIFARFGDDGDALHVERMIADTKGRGPTDIQYQAIRAIGATRRQDESAFDIASALIGGARRQGAPLIEALALELIGKRAAALAIYERIGATVHVCRLGAKDAKSLTKRESEIARLIAQGLSNRTIAERLVLSERTVEHHASAIYNKVGVRTRAEFISAHRTVGT